ncbi:MAG: glycosyltransferase [Alteriqipengyuania sp.]
MKILHVVPSFFPATRWGGPIFSTLALCDWAAAQPGIEVRVQTTDAAGPGRGERIEPPERVRTMPAGYSVVYHRRIAGHAIAPGLLLALPRAILRADLVHLTATYSFPTLPTLALARLLRRPVVWSPRGAIQAAHEWRDAPRQGVKRLFERVARRIAPKNTVLTVTAESEAQATAARMPGMRVDIVPNSVEPPAKTALVDRHWRPDGRLRLIFLGRVHEKKGIDLLIEAMSRLGPEVELDVYGSGADDYLATLNALVARFGLESRVRFHGHIDGADKSRAFHDADLFVLPSHSENFGIAIAEALAHGVPVVTTRNTPWGALDRTGCGRCIELDTGSLVAAIAELAESDLTAMGRAGRAWMNRDFSPDAVNRRLLELYRGLTASGQEGRAS